jgi:hypothetical protein
MRVTVMPRAQLDELAGRALPANGNVRQLSSFVQLRTS